MAPSSYVKVVLQVLPHATRLDSTADYHSTLLDQTQTEARTRDAEHQAATAAATAASAWMDASNTRPWTEKRPGSSRSMKSFIKSTTRRSHEEPTPCPPPDSIQPIGTYGDMSSRELEAFKALPTTIRRKVSGFFSSYYSLSLSLSYLNFDRRLLYSVLPFAPFLGANPHPRPTKAPLAFICFLSTMDTEGQE